MTMKLTVDLPPTGHSQGVGQSFADQLSRNCSEITIL